MLSTPLSHFIFRNVTYKLHFSFSRILVVEFGLTALQNFALWSFASQNIRTTASSLLRYSGPVFQAWAFALSSYVVEEMACVSWNVRMTRSESLTACQSNGPFLSAMSHILKVEFEKAETQAFLALSARLFKSLTAKFEPSSSLNAFSHILTSLLIVSQISFECDCRFRPFYGVDQSLHYIYAMSTQRSSLSTRRLQMS